ncbi:hypothetical protein [Rahnella bonaserana]|uniref:hypothetical protein n=1 Tax=Rahnella bonaserana TaxID=2816248 RepID=UPI00320A3B3E
MSDFTQLVSYRLDRETNVSESTYFVQHASRSVRFEKRSGGILDLELVIKGNSHGRRYTADMKFNEFPACGSEREAALRLASWMQRMSAAIENYWSEP